MTSHFWEASDFQPSTNISAFIIYTICDLSRTPHSIFNSFATIDKRIIFTWLQIFHRLSTFHKLLTAQISHIHKTFNIPYTFLISTDASQWPNFSPFTDATHWSDFSPFTDVTDRLFFHRHLSLPTSLFTLHQNAFPYLHKTTNDKVYPICNVSNLH